MWRSTRPIVMMATTLALCGCSEYLERRETISFHAGDAAAANRAVHTIDPWPRAAQNTTIPTSGRRVADAIERYETRANGNGPAAPPVMAIPIMPAAGAPTAP